MYTEYVEKMDKFLSIELVQVANSITLVDSKSTSISEHHLSPSNESVEGKDLVGSNVTIEGPIPEGGTSFTVKNVIDIRKDKEDTVLVYDKKRKCYVKKHK